MRCDKCGNNNDQNAKYCQRCGKTLEEHGWLRKIYGFRSKKVWKMMLASMGYIFFIVGMFILLMPKEQIIETVQPVAFTPYVGVAQKLDFSFSLTAEQDSQGNCKVVTEIKNPTPYAVSGEVRFKVMETVDKVIATGTAPFQLLQPGGGTSIISWVTANDAIYATGEIVVQEANYPITAGTGAFNAITARPINELGTDKLREYMQHYFGGGAGKPTGWYGLIDNITVYVEEGIDSVAVVKTNIAKGEDKGAAITGLHTAVMGFAADSSNTHLSIMRVDVFDREGNLIASKVNSRI